MNESPPSGPAQPHVLTMFFSEFVDSSAVKRHVSLGRDSQERDRNYLENIQSRHFALVRECVADHGGKEISTMGDSFFITFDSPEQALRCAVQIQERLQRYPITTPLGPLRLRIGMHSGSPKFFEGSWHGTDVDTAARTETAGTPGQILVSSVTYNLLRQVTEVKFLRLGKFALKGVGLVELWEADWDGTGPHRTAIRPVAVQIRKKWTKAALSTAALFGTAAFCFWLWSMRTATGSVTPRRSIAVLGFQNLSAKPEVAWLSTALAEMFNTELSAGGKLRTVPGEEVARVKSDLKLTDAMNYTAPALERIRQTLGADDVVSGSFLDLGPASGGAVRLDLRAQDTKSKEVLFSVSETGTEATLSELVSKAAGELRQHLGVGTVTEAEAKALKAALPSVDATRLYAEGLQRLRASDSPGARDVLQKAIAADPKYPLAHSALSTAWANLGNTVKANEEAKAAFDLSADLSREERLRIEAAYRESTKDWKQAATVYRALFALHPDNLENGLRFAWAQTACGDGKAALVTLGALRKLPAPAKDDPRISLEEKTATESLPADPSINSKSTLELTGGVPGAHVEVDGHTVGQFDARGMLRTEIAPGDHTIELKKDNYVPVRFTSRVAAGAILRPAQQQLKMTELLKTPTLPDPRQVEAQEWERVRNSSGIDELEDFIRQHSVGAHVDEARERVAQLRQQAQAEAARQAEATEWGRLQNTTDVALLEDFRKRYPAGPNADQAARRIERLHVQQPAAPVAPIKEAARAPTEKGDVLQPLKTYESAFAQKDFNKLHAVWPSMPGEIADALRNTFKAVKSLSVDLRPEGEPVVEGDTATLICARTLHQQVGSKQFTNADRVRVVLHRNGEAWAIQSINVVR